MKSYSIADAENMDRVTKPNATDFSRTIRTIADGLKGAERRAFVAGAIAAAEQCGRHVFAFHILGEQ